MPLSRAAGPLYTRESQLAASSGGGQTASTLDIDGLTDIGADIADADLIIIDDGGGGTNRKSAVTRIPTYVFSELGLDEDGFDSNSATKFATQQSIKAYVDAQVTAQDLDATTDSGTIAIDLDSETLTIAGGEGIDTSATGNTITIAGEDATTSNKGVASFSSDNFAVSSGAVTIKDGGVANAELAGSIANAKLANSSITVADGSSSTAVALGGTITFAGTSNEVEVGESSGTVTIGLPDDVTIAGDLTVNGDTVTVNTSTLSVEDPLILLGNGNGADSVDLGLYAKYTDSGVKYAGFFRDASDSDKWKLFATTGNSHEAPTTTVNTTSGFTLGTLVVDSLEGTITTAAQTNITSIGTIATGTWEATDIAVAHGGTGVSTLTDGGVLLGSGTGAITAMAVLADGEMIVGDGTTDPVAESGATLRTSIGIGTGDSPQLTGIELGHASDTTIVRASSGDITIEGNAVYRAGGTDVPVADGGTGASSLTDGGVLLGSGTGAVTAMAVLADGEMIVGDGTTDPVAESGATLRTSIGVGTGDSPQFTGIELGHASDTTIVRASSGDITIEGNAVYRAGGTDVPVADGGTGASSLTANGVLIGNGTSAIASVDMSTKGHLLIGDGSGNPSMLAIGTNNQVLTADSGETTGVKWADAASGGMTAWILEDDDGTEVSISDAEEVKFIGAGITTNWTDTSNGSDGDPFDLTFTVDAAQTGITSIYATDLILGEDAETAIDFGTANEIDFKADNAARLTLSASAFYPVTNNQIDLGTSSLEFKDAFFDGTVTADAFAGPLTGNVTGTADVATVATTVTITDNESTDEDNAIIFTAGGDVDGGNIGLESDGTLTYNPSSGLVTATAFAGALTGNVTGNASGTAATVTGAAQTNITSLGTLTALTVDDVAVDGKVITMTGSSSDTAVFTAGTNGTLSIVTTDAAAAAANIQITADGTVDIDSAGVLTLDSGAAINIEPASGSAILLDGTISIDAGVVTGATSITSTAFVGDITGDVTGTADVATVATTVTITDNESTNENNAVIFTAGGDVDGGNLGLESDGNLTYNPSNGTLTATAFSGALTGNVTGTADVATVATTVTITDNESTDEDNAIIFTAGGDVDGGNIGLESDGTLTYNPSTGVVTATGFVGALTGNVTGTASVATVATTVTITDNESTDESNAIIFTAGGDVDGGNIGLESDGTLTYNPSTGVVTATGFAGALTGNVTGNASGTAATVTGAAQTNITSLGTLTALTVDDVAVNGKVITMTGSSSDTAVMTVAANGAFSLVTTDAAAAAANVQITADGTVDIDSAGVLTLDSGAAINIEPASGSAILLDGTISIDAGVVTGATSITSTAFVGDITGDVTGTADVATVATTVTITDNENTNENNAVIFTAGGDVDGGNLGLESDGNLTYNPSSGTLTATAFSGALTGNVTGTADVATVATTVTITDNENTNETNAIIFTAGGDVDGGNIGLESDGDLTYNPSSGTLSATALAGTLSTAAQGNVTSLGTLTALTVDDVAVNGKVITMTGSTDDTAVMTVATNGALTIETTDTAAAAANIQITADGTAELAGTTVTLDSGGAVVLDSATGIVNIQDGGSTVLSFTEGNSGDVTVKLETNAKDLVFTDNGDATNMKILDAAAGINVPGEVQTTGIAFTDGDNAMTIVDGGAVTFPVSIDITGSAGIILENDETITNSTNGQVDINGNVMVGSGSGNATVKSSGNHDIIVQTGNSTTGSITITDGANGDITLAPNGTGEIAADSHISVADSHYIELESAAGTPGTDDSAQGIVIEFLAAEAITQWDAVYVSTTTGRVGRADATNAAKMPVIGIAIEPQGSAGSAVRVLTHGVYRDDGGFGGNMTVGVDLYAPETAGNLTTTRPSDDDDFVQVIGVAIGVRSAFINPDLTVLKLD